MWWRMEHMKGPITTGISFGLTSGVITTLGLMVGLHSGTHSAIAVIGGVIILSETMTERKWMGCALMLAGMLMARTKVKRET